MEENLKKYGDLLASAQKCLDAEPQAWSAAAIRTVGGEIFSAARNMDSISLWRADIDLAEALTKAGNPAAEMVVLCRNGALEVPGWHLRGLLLALDARNGDAEVLLKGADYTTRSLASL